MQDKTVRNPGLLPILVKTKARIREEIEAANKDKKWAVNNLNGAQEALKRVDDKITRLKRELQVVEEEIEYRES